MDKSVYRGYIDIPCSAVNFSRKMYNIYNVSNVLEQVPIDHTGYPKWDITLTLLFAWIVAYLCICKGIKTSGKVSIECVNHRLFMNQNACLCVIFVCVLFFFAPHFKEWGVFSPKSSSQSSSFIHHQWDCISLQAHILVRLTSFHVTIFGTVLEMLSI